MRIIKDMMPTLSPGAWMEDQAVIVTRLLKKIPTRALETVPCLDTMLVNFHISLIEYVTSGVAHHSFYHIRWLFFHLWLAPEWGIHRMWLLHPLAAPRRLPCRL